MSFTLLTCTFVYIFASAPVPSQLRNWERKRLVDVSGSPLFSAASTMAIEARIAEDASYQNAFTDTSLHIFTKESIDDTLIDSIGSFT